LLTNRRAAPLVLGCQDKHFLLDEEPARFPKLSLFASFFVDLTLARRHANVWRFNPSNMYGQPRKLCASPDVIIPTTSPSKHPSSPQFSHNMQLGLLVLVLLVSFLSAYFRLFNMEASASEDVKLVNISKIDPIF
jgi:hypothetical protein